MYTNLQLSTTWIKSSGLIANAAFGQPSFHAWSFYADELPTKTPFGRLAIAFRTDRTRLREEYLGVEVPRSDRAVRTQP